LGSGGGRLDHESPGPGGGTCFAVTLPAPIALDRAPPEVREAASETRETASARTVLVIDDNRDAAESLADLLRVVGHEVVVRYDGESGVTAGLDHAPDVAFVDMGLPDISGYEVAARLRAQAQPPLLVALTGGGSPADRRQAAEAGFDRHLTKPADSRTVVRLASGDALGEE
jgi:CheY-like chemotaxis protein